MKQQVQAKFLPLHRKLEKEVRKAEPIRIGQSGGSEPLPELTPIFKDLTSQEGIRKDVMNDDFNLVEVAV
jgi:hypothetical protein